MICEHNHLVDWLVAELARERAAIEVQLRAQHDEIINQARRFNTPGGLLAAQPVEGLGKQKIKNGNENEILLPENLSTQKQNFSDNVPIERLETDMLPMCSSQKSDMDLLLKSRQDNEIDQYTTDIHQRPLNADSQIDSRNTKCECLTKSQTMANILREHVGFSEPKPNPCFSKMVVHPVFEVVSSVLILVNIVVMAAEIQYRGLKVGYEYQLSTEGFDPNAWTDAELTFTVLDRIFNVVFTSELVLRIFAWRLTALKSIWIHLDIVIVCSSILASFDVSTVDPSMMRIVRLARMIRVLKIVQAIRSFDSMFFLLRSIQASWGAFMWSFILLCFIQLAGGMFMHQVLKPYMTDTHILAKHREEVYNFFGTFTKTMLTMFEITFANWVPVCRLLVNNVTESYGLFFIFYRCMFCFAVVKVIAAVFISETNRIVAGDAELAVVKSQRAREDYTRKLKTMFQLIDTSGDGKLTWAEFEHLLSDNVTCAWANAMEIDTRELEQLFTFLDTGDGEVTLDEFMDGIPKMRGNARSTDVVHMLALARRMEHKINSIQGMMQSQRMREERTASLRNIMNTQCKTEDRTARNIFL